MSQRSAANSTGGEASTPSQSRIVQDKDITFISNANTDQSPVVDFNDVAYGTHQDYPLAPLKVPPGFASQIPYSQAINSAIIQNPTTLPMTDFWKMCCSDPVVYASMLQRITRIVTRIGDYNNKNQKYKKHIRSCLKRVGEMKIKQSLATSIIFGVAAIKINWVNDYDTGLTMPDSILHLPPDSILLAVTPEGFLDKEMGLLHYYYNNASGWQQNPKAYGGSNGNAPYSSLVTYLTPQRQVAFNPMFLSAIPEDWRIIHTFNPIGIAGNHWGTSILLPIYSTLMDKFSALKKLQIALTFKASPLVFLFTNTETKVEIAPGVYESMAQNLSKKLPSAARSGICVVEGMNSVKEVVIDNTADLEKMIHSIEFLNSEIREGLVSANGTGNAGSFANAKVNMDTQKDIDDNILEQFTHTLMAQFVERCLKFAYPDVSEDEYGYFEIVDNSLNDQLIAGKVAEIAKSVGVIDLASLDDVNLVRRKMGLPPLDKLSDDMLMGMFSDSPRGVNVATAKEDVGEPYSDGLDSHEKKFS
jgi:hypothetical protein